jgi:hypothetical protein
MNSDMNHHSDLDAFEARLKTLVPRQPISDWESAEITPVPLASHPRRRGYYIALSLSASAGALVGAACTLLALQWNLIGNTDQQTAIEVASSERPIQAEHPLQPSVARKPVPTAIQPTGMAAQTMDAAIDSDVPSFWLEDELRKLAPGSLGVGTRLISRTGPLPGWNLVSASRTGEKFSRLQTLDANRATQRSVHDSFSEPALPQRQWMESILNSPSEFF